MNQITADVNQEIIIHADGFIGYELSHDGQRLTAYHDGKSWGLTPTNGTVAGEAGDYLITVRSLSLALNGEHGIWMNVKHPDLTTNQGHVKQLLTLTHLCGGLIGRSKDTSAVIAMLVATMESGLIPGVKYDEPGYDSDLPLYRSVELPDYLFGTYYNSNAVKIVRVINASKDTYVEFHI